MLKTTFLIEQTTGKNRKAGFSETWYIDSSVDQAVGACDQLAKRRSGFLTRAATITAVRVQTVGSNARIFNLGYTGVLNVQQDIPQMAIACRVQGAAVQNIKRFQLRGVADANVVEGDFQVSQAFNAAFEAWGGTLADRSFRFKAKNQTAPKVNVVSIAADGAFAFAAAITYNVGDTIDILRAKDTNGKNVSGSYYVSVKTSDTVGKFLNWGGSVVQLKGQARAAAPIYPLVLANSWQIEKVTTRKVGRPFDLYSGRRRRR